MLAKESFVFFSFFKFQNYSTKGESLNLPLEKNNLVWNTTKPIKEMASFLDPQKNEAFLV